MSGQAKSLTEPDASPSSLVTEGDSATATRRSTTGAPLVRLLGLALPHRRLLGAGLALTLASTAVGLVPAYVTMPLIDEVLVPSQTAAVPMNALPVVFGYLAVLLGAATCAWLLTWAQGAVLAVVSERVGAHIRNLAFTHLLRLDVTYFDHKRSGDLVNRIGAETDNLCSFMSDSLVDFISDVLMIVGTCLVLASLHPTLGLIATCSFPLIAAVTFTLRRRLSEGFAHGGRVRARMVSLLADAVTGIRVIKAFGQERRHGEEFEAVNERVVHINNRTNALWTFYWPVITFLNQVGLLVVWACGAWLVLESEITVGMLTAYIAYIGRFYGRVESMSRMLGKTERAAASAERLFEIIDRKPSRSASVSSPGRQPIEGAIRLSDVSFLHGSRQVLHDVTLQVNAKTLVGIAGHTGSGKTTLANLLSRFYESTAGRITVDGTDIRDIPMVDYRAQVGVVPQDPFLFYGGVAENIAFGRPGTAVDHIVQAARVAMAHDFILRLPHAYNTAVGERGQSLSGGERQRVALARALLIDPRILILDEATSAVDLDTERKIQRALDGVAVGRTVVVIAHRLSTLRHADTIFVLSQGQLVETGTHEQLLEEDGEYARLWALTMENRSPLPDGREAPEVEYGDTSSSTHAIPLVPAAHAALYLDRDNQLQLSDTRDPHGSHSHVRPKRCFPLSSGADEYISLVDDTGRERAFITHADELPPQAARTLRDAVRALDPFPTITHIAHLKLEPTTSFWEVITDRGATQFALGDEEKVRWVNSDRYAITDTRGTTYVIPSLAALDRASRRRFRRFSA